MPPVSKALRVSAFFVGGWLRRGSISLVARKRYKGRAHNAPVQSFYNADILYDV
jgi:hypothetical protein